MQAQEKINLYIAERPEWQRKVLVRLRQLIHSASDEVEENWRWNAPHFDHDGIMLGMVAFKHHVAVWFHKGALVQGPKGLFGEKEKGSDKGMLGYKLSESDQIDEKAFLDLVKQAIKVNQSGAKLADSKPTRKALVVPPDLEGCLKKNEEAWRHWERFNYTHKKEYVEWITDAKKEETRKRRIAQALEMIREGTSKEEKYKTS